MGNGITTSNIAFIYFYSLKQPPHVMMNPKSPAEAILVTRKLDDTKIMLRFNVKTESSKNAQTLGPAKRSN